MKTPVGNPLKLLCASALLACALGTHAASFDCAKAKSEVEKMVCSDAETSALDNKLQLTYTTALAATDAYGKKALAKEQRNWIKYTRSICQDISCIRVAYTERIEALAQNERYIEDGRQSCVPTANDTNDGGHDDCDTAMQGYRDPNSHIGPLNQSLNQSKQSGRIIGCSRLISLWPGHHIGPGRGIEHFGGYCTLQDGAHRRSIEICTGRNTSPLDEPNEDYYIDMRGVKPQEISMDRLVKFTYECE